MTIIESVKLASTLLKYGTKAHEVLSRYGANAKFNTMRAQVFDDWFIELVGSVNRLLGEVDNLHREQVRQRLLEDPAGMALLANYCSDAYDEALDERRRMLQFAAASIANLSLTIPQLARVQRLLRELDSDDLLALYGLWLVPTSETTKSVREQYRAGTGAALRFALWQQSQSDALVSSGCLRISAIPEAPGATGSDWSSWVHEQADVTPTGVLLLKALKSYITARSPSRGHIPGHETSPGFRTEHEARELLGQCPQIAALCSSARTFGFGIARYDGSRVTEGSPPDGKARLSIPVVDPQGIVASDRNKHAELQVPVSHLAIEHIGTSSSGQWIVQITGPHDVLRHVAYDIDAAWD